MIFELERDEYGRVRPLFAGLRDHPVIDSVIDGYTPGRIIVDDADCPRVACLWNRMDAVMVCGDPSMPGFLGALGRAIHQDWGPDARRRQIPWFSWHYCPYAWAPVLTELLAPAGLQVVDRTLFCWHGPRIDWRAAAPPGATLQHLDNRLLARNDLENMDKVAGWITSFWHSVPDFASHGVGACVILGDVIVSWCLSVFVAGKRRELGVETAPEHRGHGYATLAAAACVDECLALGVEPVWQCDRSNLPSMAVAEKVGFRAGNDYAALRLSLDQLGQGCASSGGSTVGTVE
jgi:RimJ/RimL family protein N-acetyltransferase